MKHFRIIPDDTNFDFFKPMRFWLAVSTLGVLLTLIILPIRGLNYGVDFLGGTLILVEFPQHRDIGEYRAVLDGLDLGEVAVTEASGGSGGQVVLMRIGASGETESAQAEIVPRVQEALNAAFPGATYLQIDNVGGKVSGELVQTGIIAVVVALFAIMVYVWLRFEWQFGVGAVVSLLHDVIVTVGVFSVLQLQFDLTIVAALLTIIGFSINDTVVVFDRVRENLRKYKKMPLRDVMNLALNETLSRTFMTVFTVLIALFALLLFGGPVVFGFAFAVIFGILCGTYSSIWVASAIVLRLGVKRDWATKSEGKAGTRFGGAGA
jgi:preprotein translocase subunit SecF